MAISPRSPYPVEIPAGLSTERSPQKSTIDQVKTWLGSHPQITVGGAIAIGVILGWIVKRR